MLISIFFTSVIKLLKLNKEVIYTSKNTALGRTKSYFTVIVHRLG